jgi:3-methyladenine DNA glycosylase AlkD
VHAQRFFKTGKGQYGEGDVFAGIRVPDIRSVAKRYKLLPLPEVQKIIDSKVHEYRMTGLLILTYRYPKANDEEQKVIYDFYIKNLYKGNINNWDLVDVTTPNIVGEYLRDKPREILYELAKSDDLWQRRVSMLATFAFIKRGDARTSLEIAELLLHDSHDLIHKAVGWMLREVGKRVDQQILTDFLDLHSSEMPRTMLRYAIEKLSSDQKQYYLAMRASSR